MRQSLQRIIRTVLPDPGPVLRKYQPTPVINDGCPSSESPAHCQCQERPNLRAGETVEASISQRNKAAGAALSSTLRGPVATALHVDLSPTPLGCVTSGKFSTSLGLGPQQANRDEKALLRRQCQEDSGRSSAECRLRPLQIALCRSQSLPSLGLIQTLCAFPPWGCLGSWVGGHIREGAS